MICSCSSLSSFTADKQKANDDSFKITVQIYEGDAVLLKTHYNRLIHYSNIMTDIPNGLTKKKHAARGSCLKEK
jgi:hypothetical protein